MYPEIYCFMGFSPHSRPTIHDGPQNQIELTEESPLQVIGRTSSQQYLIFSDTKLTKTSQHSHWVWNNTFQAPWSQMNAKSEFSGHAWTQNRWCGPQVAGWPPFSPLPESRASIVAVSTKAWGPLTPRNTAAFIRAATNVWAVGSHD